MKPDTCSRRILVLSMVLAASTLVASAQTVPADRKALEEGDGAGMATIAEMYGYPGPRHLLDITGSLRMSPAQVQQVANLYDEVRASAMGKGRMIIAKEEELEDLFDSGQVDEATVATLVSQISTMRGELRMIHLRAHLKAREILTKEQLERYRSMREAARKRERGRE